MDGGAATSRLKVDGLAAVADSRPAGLPFGPGDFMWDWFGSLLLAPITISGALLQVMHPVIGAGVDQHSNYVTDPFKRGGRTVYYFNSWVYDPDKARRARQTLRELHSHVHGIDDQGNKYHALNRDPYAFVWYSMIPAMLAMHRLKRPAATAEEVAGLYEELKNFARLLGVADALIPDTYEEVQAEFDRLCTEVLARTPAAEKYVAVMRELPIPPNLPKALIPLWPLIRKSLVGPIDFFNRAYLPPIAREKMGMAWTAADQRKLNKVEAVLRTVAKASPAMVAHPMTIRWRRSAYRRGYTSEYAMLHRKETSIELPRSRAARVINRSTSIVAPAAMSAVARLGPISRAVIPRVRPLLHRGVQQVTSVPKGTRWWPALDGPVPGEWVLGPSVAAEFAAQGIESPWAAAELGYGAIYYIHGSGYTVASPETHRALVSLLSHRCGLPAFSVDYRLAPEHRFPAAADDTIAGFRWLLTQGFDPSRIVVSGDSAGGHLGLDLLRCNDLDGIPGPGAMVFFSPLLDPSFTLSAAQQKIRRDPIFDADAARRIVGWYVGDAAYDDPRLTIPITPDLPIPPTLIQVGELEMMSADAREMERQLRAAGGAVTLQIWPDQGHVFQMLSAVSAPASRAITIAADFIRDSLGSQRKD